MGTDQLSNVVSLQSDTATRVGQKFEQNIDISAMDRLTIYQLASRSWRRYLNVNEWAVISYVVDRAIGWGKPDFVACAANIMEGTDEYSGVGLPRPTFYRTLKSLESKGLITRQSRRDKTHIILNVTWKPEKVTKMLPIPKRLKEKSTAVDTTQEGQEYRNETSRSITVRPQEYHSETLNKRSPEYRSPSTCSSAFASEQEVAFTEGFPGKEKVKQEFRGAEIEDGQWGDDKPVPVQRGAPADGDPCDVAGSLQSRLTAHQLTLSTKAAAKATRLREGRALKATDVETIWKAALGEGSAVVIHQMWSIKQKGRVNQEIKKWAFSKDGTFGDMVDYGVRNWTAIVTRKMGWMTKPVPPKTPTLEFFLMRLSDFISVWASKEMDRFTNDRTNTELSRLMAKGLTHAEAIKHIAEDSAKAALREEMSKREAKVASRDRIAKEREGRAERLEGFADKHGDNPLIRKSDPTIKGFFGKGGVIHPKSETAKRLVGAGSSGPLVPDQPRPPSPEKTVGATTQVTVPLPDWETVRANAAKINPGGSFRHKPKDIFGNDEEGTH